MLYAQPSLLLQHSDSKTWNLPPLELGNGWKYSFLENSRSRLIFLHHTRPTVYRQSIAALCLTDGPIRVIIIDSVIALFRVDFSGRGDLSVRQQKLGRHLSSLLQMAAVSCWTCGGCPALLDSTHDSHSSVKMAIPYPRNHHINSKLLC